MRNMFIYLILVITSLLSNQNLHAQSGCDELKKENEYLKKALQITTPTKTINSSNIDFNLLKCEGNIKEQTVTLTLTLVNHEANQTFQFHMAKAISVEGDQYETFNISIGGGHSRTEIYTDTPVKTTITFKKVLPAVKIFKLIPISYYHGAPGHSIEIEYKDITISWK